MIKVTSLNKYYSKGKDNELHVINDMNFELPDKGIVAFLGHSGSGKTTLLNVIGGLDKASGEIDYGDLVSNGKLTRATDKYRSKYIGVVFQNYNLLKDETVQDNLRIALELIGVTDEEEIAKRVEYTLNAVGMYKYRKKKAYALSGGQQQRVAIARALIKNCKVLIADEPTGNLDSANTVEVMNILRKVSKNTLVLLVTHEEDIAAHYADYIFRISDGKIESKEENSYVGEAAVVRDNAIYLKDMNLDEAQTPIGELKIYSSADLPPADITLFFRNGTYYLKSDAPIKIFNETSFKIIDDHKEVAEKKTDDSFDYDSSFYKDLKKRRGFLKSSFYAFKDAFSRVKPTRKKTRAQYAAMVLLGFIVFLATSALMIFTVVDTSMTSYSDYYYNITPKDYNGSTYFRSIDLIQEALKEDAISNPIIPQYDYLSYRKNFTYAFSIETYDNVFLLDYSDETVHLVCGRGPSSDDEIVVSQSFAYAIMDACVYQELSEVLGDVVGGRNNRQTYTISGISDRDQRIAYVTSRQLRNYTTWYEESDAWDFRIAENEFDLNGNKIYSIVSGRDVDINSTEREMLVPESSPYEVGETINGLIEGRSYKIVGKFSYPYPVVGKNTFILNSGSYQEPTEMRYSNTYKIENDDYVITSGRDVSDFGEIIVPYTSSTNIGRSISINGNSYKVVGKYAGSTMLMLQSGIVHRNDFFTSNSNNTWFTVKDRALANNIFGEEFVLDTVLNNFITDTRISQSYYLMIFLVVAVVLYIGGLLFTYFVMRSRMLLDIKTIGTYRCIGAKKRTITGKYLLDSFVLCLMTSFVGYLIGFFVYIWLSNTTLQYLGYTLMFSLQFTVIAAFALVGVSVFFGALPVMLLLRKTPAEICAKYDI